MAVHRFSWARAWGNVWLRAALLHPTLGVAPWVVACLGIAQLPGSDIGDVSWGLWLAAFGALASFFATLVMVADRQLDKGTRFLVMPLGLLGSGIALVLGLLGWYQAAQVACHGGYECLF
jgi:hypothetical protein